MTKLKSQPSARPFLFIALMGLAASGCAKDKGGAEARTPPSPLHATLEGSISENAKRLLTGSHRATCDDAIEPKRQEVLAALAAREDQISEFQKQNKDSTTWRKFAFGPTYMRERVKPINKSGWSEDTDSWVEIYNEYLSIKDQPVNQKWASLNSYATGLLTNEVGRISKGYVYEFDKEALPKLKELAAALKACVDDEACSAPALSQASSDFLSSTQDYPPIFAKIAAAQTLSEKRNELKNFLEKWVSIDLATYSLVKEPSVTKVAEGQYILPLDLGPFAPVAEQFTKLFEEKWKTADGKSVKLKVNSPADSAWYRAVLGNELEGRAFVSRKTRTLNLMPGLRSTTIAHELGHILGFKDTYYEIFQQSDCTWKTQINYSDIMSEHQTGQVLPEHWAGLAELYK